MSDRELRRPSTWLISLGLAAAYTSARIMATIEAGRALLPSGYYVLQFVQITGTLLALIHGTHLLVLIVALLPNVADWFRRLRPQAQEPDAPTTLPPPPLTRYTRIIPGTVNGRPTHLEIETDRPARWSKWQQVAFEILAWHRVTGSLKYAKMVGAGKAFSRNEHAGQVYAELDRVGLVRLVNGQETVLRDTLPSTLALVRGGEIDWTEEFDPPPLSPAPLRRGAVSDNFRESVTVVEG